MPSLKLGKAEWVVPGTLLNLGKRRDNPRVTMREHGGTLALSRGDEHCHVGEHTCHVGEHGGTHCHVGTSIVTRGNTLVTWGSTGARGEHTVTWG